ncbi:hypothetical protein ACWCV2_22800 [Streptomyces pseudogriseolus]
MSSTRRASKRARIQRRAENDQMRTARRDSLAVLLSRAQRGVPLTVDEAALLRAAVEAEIREGDAARQAERGQQRAADRERERVTAAEAAIVEAEERARVAEERAEEAVQGIAAEHDRAEQSIRRAVEEYNRRQAAEAALDRVRALAADMRTWCSPHGIATQYADDIERALAEQPRAAVDVAPGVAVIRDRAAEQRAKEAAAAVEHMAKRHAEQQKQMHDDRRQALADALGRDTGTSWPALIEHAAEAQQWATSAAVRADRKRAEEAEQRLARIRDMADAWTRRLPDVIRTATAAEAVRNAVDGDDRPVMFAMTAEQAAPEVITDRAAIRAALDEPEPRQPSTTAERCPSCEHGPEYHTDPAGCWFTVAKGKPDRDAVCGCAVVRVTPEGAQR